MSVDSTIRLIAETVRKQLKSDSLTTAYGAFARLMSVNSRPDQRVSRRGIMLNFWRIETQNEC
jgi:hypothetical protein